MGSLSKNFQGAQKFLRTFVNKKMNVFSINLAVFYMQKPNRTLLNFNLKKFFKLHDTYIPREIVKSERVTEIQTYVPEHEEIATRYKKMAKYTCDKCGLKCHNYRHLLHLHHRNGVKSDNYPHNLQVLCVSCHSEAPDHVHLKNKFSEQINTIKQLRREQSIVDLENYYRSNG